MRIRTLILRHAVVVMAVPTIATWMAVQRGGSQSPARSSTPKVAPGVGTSSVEQRATGGLGVTFRTTVMRVRKA